MSAGDGGDFLSLAIAGARSQTVEDESLLEIIGCNNTAKIYSASYNPRYDYPYRLQMVQRASQTFRDLSYEYIIDSGFKDPEVTNRDILEKALEVRPDYIVPKDYPGRPDKTATSLSKFLSLYDDYADQIRATPIIPVQPPYRESYLKHEDVYGEFTRFAVGGLHGFSTVSGQLAAIREFRDVVGDHVHVHALGVGTNAEFVYHLRDQPDLVDSLDISTPEQAIKNNQVPDKTWIQQPFEIPQGVDSTTLRGILSKYVLYQFNYMLTDRFQDEEFDTLALSESEQTELASFASSADELDFDNPPQAPGRAHGEAVTGGD